MSKTFRIKDGFDEQLERMRIEMIVQTRQNLTEADLLHATLWKHLDKMTAQDVLQFRREVLKKDD